MTSVHVPLTSDIEHSDDDPRVDGKLSNVRIRPLEVEAIDTLPLPAASSNASATYGNDFHAGSPPPRRCLRCMQRAWVVWLLGLLCIAVVFLLASPPDAIPADADQNVPCLQGHASTAVVNGTLNPYETTPPDTLIAYIADVALPSLADTTTAELYQLIAKEGAEAIVLSGDFDYLDCPGAYDALLTKYLGANYPVFAVVGNHDAHKYMEYSHQIAARLERAGITSCVGEVGVQTVCTYKGIVIAQTSPGVFESYRTADVQTAPWLERTLASLPSRWQVCSFHKNMRRMQTGDKTDETGWGVYDACRERGAMIATGHEHRSAAQRVDSRLSRVEVLTLLVFHFCSPFCFSYARTFEILNFEQQIIETNVSLPGLLRLRPGRSFAFCNGLGGRSVREQIQCTAPNSCPWFAHMENAGTGAKAEVLFCRYNIRGNPDQGNCYLKDVADVGTDRVRDSFTLDVSEMPR